MKNFKIDFLTDAGKHSEVFSAESAKAASELLVQKYPKAEICTYHGQKMIYETDIQIKDQATLEAVLSDISFPNTSLDFKWRYEVSPCADPGRPGWFVNVAFERPDTQTGEVGIGRGRAEFISVGSWESGAVKTGWLLVELVVRHELMEAFHYRGARIFDPHHSVHALAEVRK